jgi:hypothetical protein
MGTFLKIFFGIILGILGLFVIIGSPFAGIIGAGAFIVQLVIGIAMIAGAFTLFIKARR